MILSKDILFISQGMILVELQNGKGKYKFFGKENRFGRRTGLEKKKEKKSD